MKKNWIGRSLAITAISAAVISPSSRVVAQESGDSSVVTVALAMWGHLARRPLVRIVGIGKQSKQAV